MTTSFSLRKLAIGAIIAGLGFFVLAPSVEAIQCYWNGNGPNDGTASCYENDDVAGISQEGGSSVPPPPPPTDDPAPVVASGEFSTIIEIDNDSSHGAVYDTISRTNGPLAAGAYEDASVTYTFPSYGTWYYRTCTDTGSVVVESDETNNCTPWQTITLTPPALPDLTAGNTTQGTHGGTPYVVVGTPMTFSSTASNIGNASASSFPNSFSIQNGAYFAANALALTAGQSAGISGSNTFGSTGTYNVRACADMNTSGAGSVVESNDGNNCGAYLAISVVPQAPANPTATCNAQGTSATLSWTASTGASAYYVRATKVGSCPSGWVQAGWDANTCTPSPDSVSGTSINYGTTAGTAYSFWVHGMIANGAYGPASSKAFTCTDTTLPRCSNGIDDDGDTLTDYPADPGCSGPNDTTDGPNPPIITSFTATPNRVSQGNTSTLAWTSTGATACTGTGFTAGGANGSTVVTPPALGNNNYSLTCTGAGGTSPASNVTVEVIVPTATITAEPSLARDNKTTDLKWSATEVSSCTISASPTGPTFTANYSPVTPGTNTTAVSNINDKTTFTLSCVTTTGGNVSASTQVNVRFLSDEF